MEDKIKVWNKTEPIKKGDELTTDYDDTPSFISKSNPEWNKL